MKPAYILIAFMFIGGVGFAQTVAEKKVEIEKHLSDTITYNGNVFRIVLPPKYASKLFPKITENKIALVNAKGELECLIRNYYCGFNDHGRYREAHIIDASLENVLNGLMPKNIQVFWITNVNGWGEFGQEKPIIAGFKMERVK